MAQILGKYVAFDLEWEPADNNCIDAVSFVDSTGWSEVKFRVRDFGGSEKRLLIYILKTILRYKLSMGWNTQGSYDNNNNPEILDLSILNQRCVVNRVPSPIKIGGFGLPYFKNDLNHTHIDLINVYSQELVAQGVYSGKYQTNGLDSVSKALLGYGKYKNYSGEDFASLPIEEQEKYSLMDSQLVMDLSKHDNFSLLDALLAIAEITELDFERVCKTSLTTWWKNIFNTMVKNKECPPIVKQEFSGNYRGAEVLIPNKGYYRNVVVVDAASLYPSVGINHNLSFDTINCECCKDNEKAQICNLIPSRHTADCNFINPHKDWICKQRTGAFPTKLISFKAERLIQKRKGNVAKSQALKILINGGYGAFARSDFEYYDPRVAELVTATGRWELERMQNIAKGFGMEVIYGDTDSLFLIKTSEEALSKLQEKYLQESGIELEIKNRYDKLILSEGKKHYVGFEKGKIHLVGYEGKKSDRCAYYQKVFWQVLEDILVHEIDPIPNLREAFRNLELNKVNPDLLIKSQRLNMPLEDYDKTTQIYKVAVATHKKQGEAVKFLSANAKKTGASWTLDPTKIDIPHYQELLRNTVAEVIELTGHSVSELEKEFHIKPQKKSKASHKKKRLPDNSIHRDHVNIGGVF